MNIAKTAILSRLRGALQTKTNLPYPQVKQEESVFVEQQDYLEVLFAENFQKQGGVFFYCENAEDLVAQLQSLAQQKKWQQIHCWDETLQDIFEACQFDLPQNTYPTQTEAVGITTCHGLVARTGSILMSSRQAGGRILSLLPMVHVVIATPKQFFSDLDPALAKIKNNLPAMLSIVTGPSRTADIEKTLVLGAHAPKEIYVFLLETEN